MPTNEFDTKKPETPQDSPRGHGGVFAVLTIGLVLALAGDGYLLMRSNRASDELAQMRDGTATQISKLGESTASMLDQRLQAVQEDVKNVQDNAAISVRRARAEAQKQGTELSRKLEEEQQQERQVTDQIAELKDATTAADSKISEVTTDVSGVKTDVSGVKTDVSNVKADVATTQAGLDKTGADLKRVVGDMGVMSGLIATNSRDLSALRELGERNYFEFDIARSQSQKKVGNLTLTLKKSDPKRNRYTVEVMADDKRVEKRDKTINEPVQLYVGGQRLPYEIVVNQIKKDEIVGYLATPKVTLARQ